MSKAPAVLFTPPYPLRTSLSHHNLLCMNDQGQTASCIYFKAVSVDVRMHFLFIGWFVIQPCDTKMNEDWSVGSSWELRVITCMQRVWTEKQTYTRLLLWRGTEKWRWSNKLSTRLLFFSDWHRVPLCQPPFPQPSRHISGKTPTNVHNTHMHIHITVHVRTFLLFL